MSESSITSTPSVASTRSGDGELRGIVIALFSLYFIWGSTYFAIRLALPSFPPLLLSGIRFVLAGSALYVLLRSRGYAAPSRSQWGASLLVGTLLVLGNALVCVSEQWVSSGLAAVVISSVPLWAALFAGLFGSFPSRGEWLGLAVGLCGVALLNLGGDLRASPRGAFVLVASTICWAFGSMWGRRLPLPGGLMASATEMLCGGTVVLGFSLLHGDRLQGVPGPLPLFAFAYLVVFGSMVGYSAYVYLLGKVRPALATSYAYANPIVAVALGALFAGERVTPVSLAALALILAGVALVALRKRAAPSP